MLKLMATDADGLRVISACLQDALTQVAEMSYQAKARRFAVMFNRYKWESDADGDAGSGERPSGERMRTGVHFDGVLSVQSQSIAQDDDRGLLDLLAITAEANDDGYDISLVFAGGGAVLLKAECIDVYLSDIGDGWSALKRPDHDLDGASAADDSAT